MFAYQAFASNAYTHKGVYFYIFMRCFFTFDSLPACYILLLSTVDDSYTHINICL